MVKQDYPTAEEAHRFFDDRFWIGFSFGSFFVLHCCCFAENKARGLIFLFVFPKNAAGKNYGFGSILGLLYVGMMLAVNPNVYSPSAGVFPTGMDALANAEYLLRMITSFW